MGSAKNRGSSASGSVVMHRAVPRLTAASLARFVTRAQRAIGLRGETHIVVGGNRLLRELNRRFRKKNRSTDVLSFPPALAGGAGLAGDLAISAELAAANARRLGHGTAEEVKILALHGLLHLAGYDHERDRGEMAREEQRLRRRLGLPAGLIERHSRVAIANHRRPPQRPSASSAEAL